MALLTLPPLCPASIRIRPDGWVSHAWRSVADPCAAGLCAVPLDCACVEDGTPMCLDERRWHSALTAYVAGDQRWPQVRDSESGERVKLVGSNWWGVGAVVSFSARASATFTLSRH